MNIEEKDMAGAVYTAGSRLFHFHVGDSNRAAPGMGHIDFQPILQALKDIKYAGYVTMELIPPAYNIDAYKTYADISPYYLDYPGISIAYLKEIEKNLK
jgi:sugar phosphate isomerase/epimerase